MKRNSEKALVRVNDALNWRSALFGVLGLFGVVGLIIVSLLTFFLNTWAGLLLPVVVVAGLAYLTWGDLMVPVLMIQSFFQHGYYDPAK